ncbi:hypothetical protein [Erythrobacter aureus]|uniref:Uncharacterized protein n=1 Tax=Erythrobacter aureus TaxID=2182384 RepID=A0A345YJ51_9SPHN|nr:hypothetical protein [Erythrobacter aureus]AXK43953.1 hypothetical protein DVR09_15985 [Erythrobacter aureus]
MDKRFLARCWLIVTTSEEGADLPDAAERAAKLLTDYQVSDAELAGFNETAGTAIKSIASAVSGLEPKVEEAEGITEVTLNLNLEVTLDAADESAGENDVRRAFEMFNFSEHFLAGYNSQAGTAFVHFEIIQIVSLDIRQAPAAR